MKSLAVAFFALALSAPSLAQQHGGPHNGRSARSGTPHVGVHPGWRGAWRGGHFVNHRHFRFRGRTFVFIGAPLFAAPWLYYPYVWDAQWGPRYYDPAQPGSFLFYCPEPAGYYPEVAMCPTGWYPVVPSEPGDGDY
jgi:hypothetical protein